MTDLFKAIAGTLKSISACPVYINDVPQGFRQPSWLVTATADSVTPGFNTRRHFALDFDVAWFPPDGLDPVAKKEACRATADSLLRTDHMGDYRPRNRSASLTDNVLHYRFSIRFYECGDDKAHVLMETLEKHVTIE